MVRIANEKEVEGHDLPNKVSAVVKGVARTLDDAYGENRHWRNDLGGVVLIFEKEEDFDSLNEFNTIIDEIIPEYVDFIQDNDDNWLLALVLLSSDYSLTLVMPMYLAPTRLIDYDGIDYLSDENNDYK